jgi:hypothetical protein
MAKRKLSILQKAYREFFLAALSNYEVVSPSQLNYEQKKEFFTNIKENWQQRKAELLKEKAKHTPTTSKHSNYAKVKVVRPAVALEPKQSYTQNSASNSEDAIEKILSEDNPEQTDDLRIKYDPNQFFEQEDLIYNYPVVKMPAEGSLLKLPRTGRAQSKGYKEHDFYTAIQSSIPEIEVSIDLHMAIPFFNRPYEPDIALIDRDLNLYIDIEIDEPYDGYFRFPTHETEKDDKRDLFFTESGWIVIRFTERQVHLQEKQCIAYIKDVLNSIYNYRLEETSNCISEPQWDYQQAVRWEKAKYREKYLNIEAFGKQKRTSEIVVDIQKSERIEQFIDRTKKPTTDNQQDNIAFEDETHTYHHRQDGTGNAEYISVTTLIDRFFPFDMEKFIEGKAKKDGVSKATVLEEFLDDRDRAAEKGTLLHEQIEGFLKGEKHDSSTKEFALFKNFYDEVIIAKGFEFVKAERRILLSEFNVAGTIDALFRKPNSDDYVIFDWKRSKKLVIDCHPRKMGYGFALSELSNLDNSSYYKYALQQNIYKYILEKEDGISVSSMNLIVLHEDYPTYCRVALKTMTDEVKIILNSINHKI